MRWNYLSFLKCCQCWSFGMAEHALWGLRLFINCGIKVNSLAKRDTGIIRNWEIHAWRDMQIVSTVCRKHIVNVFEIDCIGAMTANGCLADMQKWHGLWDGGISDSGSCNFLTRMYPMWRCLSLINGARNCYCVLIRTMWCHSQYFAFCWSILFYSSIVTRHWNLVDHKWRCTVKYVPCSFTSVTFFTNLLILGDILTMWHQSHQIFHFIRFIQLILNYEVMIAFLLYAVSITHND